MRVDGRRRIWYGAMPAFVAAIDISRITAVEARDDRGAGLPHSEIASRTHAGIYDVLLAVAAGTAGALAFTKGFPTALIGVMVAVALLPPAVTAGLLVGSGRLESAVRALGLLATNVACLNLAALVTFLGQGIQPRSFWDEKKAKKAAGRAVLFWLALVILLALVITFTWD